MNESQLSTSDQIRYYRVTRGPLFINIIVCPTSTQREFYAMIPKCHYGDTIVPGKIYQVRSCRHFSQENAIFDLGPKGLLRQLARDTPIPERRENFVT